VHASCPVLPYLCSEGIRTGRSNFSTYTVVEITEGICKLKLPAGIPWGKILDTHCRYSVETTALNSVTATRGASCLVFQRSRVQNLARTPAALIFPWLPSVCACTIREHDRCLCPSRIGCGLDGLSSNPGSSKTVFLSSKTSRGALRPTPPRPLHNEQKSPPPRGG
jgi:hypothetical protein